MSNQGIRGFYQLTEAIKEQLLEDKNINTVTTGDITDVNLNKQDIFPLGHIIINSVIDEEQVLRFNISVLATDMVNRSKDATIDRFTGNNNVQDILNTQLALATRVIRVLKKADVYREQFEIDGAANCEPFQDRFQNHLAGWAVTFTINTYDNMTYC